MFLAIGRAAGTESWEVTGVYRQWYLRSIGQCEVDDSQPGNAVAMKMNRLAWNDKLTRMVQCL